MLQRVTLKPRGLLEALLGERLGGGDAGGRCNEDPGTLQKFDFSGQEYRYKILGRSKLTDASPCVFFSVCSSLHRPISPSPLGRPAHSRRLLNFGHKESIFKDTKSSLPTVQPAFLPSPALYRSFLFQVSIFPFVA